MFRWLFAKKCEHDFKIVKTIHRSYVDDYGRIINYGVHVLYCPKCDKEKSVDADKYDLEKEKQRIKANYKR